MIVETALRLSSEAGVDAVSLRDVAAELHTGPSSLYVWVPNRQALKHLMLARSLRGVPLPEPRQDRWRAQLVDLVDEVSRALEVYPGLARVLLGTVPVDAANLRIANGYLEIMLVGRVPPLAAAYAVDLLNLYVGSSSFERSLGGVRTEDASGAALALDRSDAAAARSLFEAQSSTDLPAVRRLAAEMGSGSLRERFTFGLRTIVDGLPATR